MMQRLKNFKEIIYDANIIIYYCFFYKNTRILELTSKSRALTEYLFNNNIDIIVPKFVKEEIEKKGFYMILEEYLNSKNINQIIGFEKPLNDSFRYNFLIKIRSNFVNFQKNAHVFCLDVLPKSDSLNLLKRFFDEYNDEIKLKEFYARKHSTSLNPSKVDLMLMAISKDIEMPLISNDYDITFFSEELKDKDLVGEIISFNSIKYEYS